MAVLTTITDIKTELAATADYDVAFDRQRGTVAFLLRGLRKNRDSPRSGMAALRRKLDFPQSSGRGEQNIAFAMQAIENQLQQVLAWIAANNSPTEAQRLANPDVVHADFSTFRGYSC